MICNEDSEANSGLQKLKQDSFSICYWNLDSLPAHSFAKLMKWKLYNWLYKRDFIYLSETYLDSTTHDNLLEIECYNPVRVDYPNNVNIGGVSICYKESLSFQVIN